jgi:hypothetical protein
MCAHPNDVGVQKCGIPALGNFAVGSDQRCDELVSKEAHVVICVGMRKHPTEVRLQEYANAALEKLSLPRSTGGAVLSLVGAGSAGKRAAAISAARQRHGLNESAMKPFSWLGSFNAE